MREARALLVAAAACCCMAAAQDGEPGLDSTQVVSARKLVAFEARERDGAGTSVSAVGDLDGDGVTEIAVGAPDRRTPGSGVSGAAFVFSGSGLTDHCELVVPNSGGDRVGRAVAGVGDVTGDGVPDIAVGVPDRPAGFNNEGQVVFFTGAACLPIADACSDNGLTGVRDLGHSLAALGDLSGDGVAELAAAAPASDLVVVFSSTFVRPNSWCRVLYRLVDPAGRLGSDFGWSVARVDDVTGDGLDEIVVGAPGDSTLAREAGAVAMFSGADGAPLWKGFDPAPGAFRRFGVSVAGIGDLSGDGEPDVAVGGPGLFILSGADGAFVTQLVDPGGQPDDGLGRAVASVGDIDGDNIPEIAATASTLDGPGGADQGALLLFRGSDGTLLRKLLDPQGEGGDRLGDSVASLADLSGDGVSELLVGVPWDDERGESLTGSAVVFALENDVDGDGVGPFGGDCDDGDPLRFPGSPEVCDGADNDCDGSIDDDRDGDGFGLCSDCDDSDRRVHPTAIELCDGRDGDCDGVIDDGPDADLDGFGAPCDCNDSNGSIFPGAPETCDLRDESCDGRIDDGFAQATSSSRLGDPQLAGVMRARLGSTVAALGDLTGDGLVDFAAGAPGAESVTVYSGADRSVVCRLTDPDPGAGQSFGAAVAAAGDMTGDGTPDILVGAYRDINQANVPTGSAMLFAGEDCTFVRRFADPGPFQEGWLGHSVAAAGDLDRDGVPDLLAGAPRWDQGALRDQGAALAFSGADGSLLHRLRDPQGTFDDQLGWRVAAIADVSGDAVPDLAVAGLQNRKLVVFSGADGTFLYRTTGMATFPRGSIAALDDVTGDGIADLAAKTVEGFAVFSGANGAFHREYLDPQSALHDRVGHAVAGFADLDGDGVSEILAGAPTDGSRTPGTFGQVLVFSGADGTILRRLVDPSGRGKDFLGAAVAALDDLSGDGVPEILAGADGVESPAAADVGLVLLFVSESDCDADGYGAFGGDCDDADPGTNPGVPDPCDGIDQNDCVPGDGSGEPWLGFACDGADSDFCTEGVFECLAGAQTCSDRSNNDLELCNGVDDDCDGGTDDPPCAYFDAAPDGRIDGHELGFLGRAFGLCDPVPASQWWGPIDYTGDGCVDGDDLAVLAHLWGKVCVGQDLTCE